MGIEKFNLAWLVLTYACNNRCRWCYASSNNSYLAKSKTFREERQDGTLDLLKDIGIRKITLIGGEPSIYPNLDLLIEKIYL